MPDHLTQLTPHLAIHHGCCNAGILRDGERALLIDCGDGAVRSTFVGLNIRQIDQILFTHHHRDSASGVQKLASVETKLGVPAAELRWFEQVERFWNDPKMRWHLYNIHPHNQMLAETVIEQPRAWRIPCLSPATRVDRRTTDGESWNWNEFHLTAYHFPGQTYYHGGLLVEGHGVRLFFSGDSFTPAGIDDYCAGNRNLLGTGVGFDRCLALMERLQPMHIFNCHVDHEISS